MIEKETKRNEHKILKLANFVNAIKKWRKKKLGFLRYNNRKQKIRRLASSFAKAIKRMKRKKQERNLQLACILLRVRQMKVPLMKDFENTKKHMMTWKLLQKPSSVMKPSGNVNDHFQNHKITNYEHLESCLCATPSSLYRLTSDKVLVLLCIRFESFLFLFFMLQAFVIVNFFLLCCFKRNILFFRNIWNLNKTTWTRQRYANLLNAIVYHRSIVIMYES